MKIAFLCFGEKDAFDYTRSFEYIKAYLTEVFKSDKDYHYPWNLLSAVTNTSGYVGHQNNIPVFQIFAYFPSCNDSISDKEIESEILNHYRERSYLVDSIIRLETIPYRVIIQDINIIDELNTLISEWNNGDNCN